MERAVSHDERGLTLVEVMIALLVLLAASLALLETALLSIESNRKNAIRQEALEIAQIRMNEARDIPFDKLSDDSADAVPDDNLVLEACSGYPVNDQLPYPVKVTRSFGNVAGFDFGTRRTVVPMGSGNKQITILVRWVYREECCTHSLSTIMGKQ